LDKFLAYLEVREFFYFLLDYLHSRESKKELPKKEESLYLKPEE
jgi:hypothetical protein